MDIIAKARELGHAIQADERYKRLQAAAKTTESDEVLQANIEKFNDIRTEISYETGKPERDAEKIAELDKSFRAVYTEIVGSESMREYNEAKEGTGELLSMINTIISGSMGGANPDEIDETAGCEGDCGSCGGCGK